MGNFCRAKIFADHLQRRKLSKIFLRQMIRVRVSGVLILVQYVKFRPVLFFVEW